MSKLGFTVYRYDNRTTSEILSSLKQYVCSSSNQDANAFGCAFFSHGEDNGELATFDDFINVKDLVEQTHHGKDLVGKPRLFFFQGKLLFDKCTVKVNPQQNYQHAAEVIIWMAQSSSQ